MMKWVFLKQIYKPNSVLNDHYKNTLRQKALIIYLSALLPKHFSCPPSNIERAVLKR